MTGTLTALDYGFLACFVVFIGAVAYLTAYLMRRRYGATYYSAESISASALRALWEQQHMVTTSATTRTLEPGVIDLDAVVEHLHRMGVHAYVEQTGGGTATIYAGARWHEEGWGDRWAAIAGPGWFDGPNWTQGRAHADDFYVGPDDDGASNPDTITSDDPAVIALAIAAVAEKYRNGPVA